MALVAILIFSCSKERYITEPGNLVPLTVMEDPAIPSIIVNGARLHAEAFGHPDSTLVVFLHGGPGGDYRSLLNGKDLANHGYRVVFYDQRGSGLSQRFSKDSYLAPGYSILDTLYHELSGVIAHYRSTPGQKVFLVGRSWGAILATAYAAKYPGSVQGLVVAEPGGLKWEDIKTYTKAARSFNLWGEALNNSAFLDQFISGSEDQHAILDYKLGLLASRNEITGEDNTLPGSMWREGAVINAALYETGKKYNPDFAAGIGAFHVPVLLLYSEHNKAYPLSWAQKIAASYAHVSITLVPGTGHTGIFHDAQAWSSVTMPAILHYFSTL